VSRSTHGSCVGWLQGHVHPYCGALQHGNPDRAVHTHKAAA
jgi:hypothetical protein